MLLKWSLPQTATQWYTFIGFVNFLSCFIPNCSSLLKPLYSHHSCLVKKEPSNISSTILQHNFNQLKEYIKQSVGLQLFNPNETIYLITDASDKGVNDLILQRSNKVPKQLVPITFFSKNFTPTQSRYTVLERELLGILLALSHNYLLLINEIIVLTDHQALISISNKSMLKILKFLETLSTYPVTIKYLPGTSNNNFADFLSVHFKFKNIDF